MALLALVASAGLAFVNLCSLIATAVAAAFLVFNILRARKAYPGRIDAAVSNLTETMEQIAEFRRYYQGESEKREEIMSVSTSSDRSR